ncbi:MAG: LPS assembly lipoprotein LptE [Pseudomonadota bacterium]
MVKTLAAALTALLLAGCGFTPVYSDVSSSTGPIAVETIPGRSGHILRRELLRDLKAGLPGVDESAVLTVTLDESLSQLAFSPDGAASRSSVRASAQYVLALSDNAVSGTINSTANFNVPDNPYGDISAQQAAYERAMLDLARLMVDDLRIKLTAIEGQ